jgi:methyl-accepting chemotaxis protein
MQANEVARTAAADVSSTNDDIAALVRIARRIGDVVKLIEAIAEQTNLLALNATIEAARAVKPVAVLQWLLRRLSRWLCKQPKQPISSVQASTTGAVTAIGAITRRMQEINAHTTEVVNSVERQELATGEISINVASAASESKVVVAALSDVASGVKQTRSSAETVLNASEEVMTATEKLCGEVEGFLRTVAA